VVAIARNSPKGMGNAKKLMDEHFPGANCQIVRTVEVETGGTRATYAGDSGETALGSSKGLNGVILSGATFGRKAARRQAESLKVAECRIVYKKRNPDGLTKLTFSEAPEYTPRVYTDQVVEAVLSSPEKALALARTDASKRDIKVAPAAGEIEPPGFPKLGGK